MLVYYCYVLAHVGESGWAQVISRSAAVQVGCSLLLDADFLLT